MGTHCSLGCADLDTQRGDTMENPSALGSDVCGYDHCPLPSIEWALAYTV